MRGTLPKAMGFLHACHRKEMTMSNSRSKVSKNVRPPLSAETTAIPNGSEGKVKASSSRAADTQRIARKSSWLKKNVLAILALPATYLSALGGALSGLAALGIFIFSVYLPSHRAEQARNQHPSTVPTATVSTEPQPSSTKKKEVGRSATTIKPSPQQSESAQVLNAGLVSLNTDAKDLIAKCDEARKVIHDAQPSISSSLQPGTEAKLRDLNEKLNLSNAAAKEGNLNDQAVYMKAARKDIEILYRNHGCGS